MLFGSVCLYYVVQTIRKVNAIHRMALNSQKIKFRQEKCSICLEPLLQIFEEVDLLACDHTFHNSCFSKWILTNTQKCHKVTCPMCRSLVISRDSISTDDISSISGDLQHFWAAFGCSCEILRCRLGEINMTYSLNILFSTHSAKKLSDERYSWCPVHLL
jgi:hypothetical protein